MKELGGYSTDDAKKFRTGVASQEEGKEKSWKENNGFIQDKNVPFGWKIMRFQSSNGQARIISRAPDGSKFKGLIPALQHMIKAEYPKEDIELLANNLNQIDWLKNPNIPESMDSHLNSIVAYNMLNLLIQENSEISLIKDIWGTNNHHEIT